MTENDIDAKLAEMKRRVKAEPVQNHQEEMRKAIVARLEEIGYTPREQLYNRGGGLDDCVVYRGMYIDPENPGAEPIEAAAKITTNASLGSILNPNIDSYTRLKAAEIQTWRQVNHPNIPRYIKSESFPLGLGNLDILLTYFIDAPTVRDRIKRGNVISEKEAGMMLKQILSAENHVHTELDTPMVIRDVHPGNILLNSKAYITDFNLVRPVNGERTNLTQIENGGYLPLDAIGTNPKPHHDIASLGNVVIAGALAQEIGKIRAKQGVYGLDSVSTRELPYSKELRDYLAKMISPPERRFQTAKEAIEGLERILGIPVRIEQEKPKEVAKSKNYNLPEVIDVGNGELIVKYFDKDDSRGFLYGDGFKEGKSVRETLENIRTSAREHSREYVAPISILGYLQYIAPQFPVLQEVLSEERSLGDIVREKGPSFFNLLKRAFKGNLVDPAHPSSLSDVRNKYKEEKQKYKEKKKQLYEILGLKERNFKLNNTGGKIGSAIGYAAAALSALSPYTRSLSVSEYLTLAGSEIVFGGIIGSNIERYFEKRKLKNHSREADSYLEEARRVLNPSPLEIKAGENVDLTEEEKKKYNDLTTGIGALACGVLGAASYGLFHHLGLHTPEVLAWTTGLGVGVPWTIATKNLLINRKLKQKRLAAGLDKDGMREYKLEVEKLESFDPWRRSIDELLSGLNLKKIPLMKRFFGEGIKVTYKTILEKEWVQHKNGNYSVMREHYPVTIRASSEEKARAVYDKLSKYYIVKDMNGSSDRFLWDRDADMRKIDPLRPSVKKKISGTRSKN